MTSENSSTSEKMHPPRRSSQISPEHAACKLVFESHDEVDGVRLQHLEKSIQPVHSMSNLLPNHILDRLHPNYSWNGMAQHCGLASNDAQLTNLKSADDSESLLNFSTRSRLGLSSQLELNGSMASLLVHAPSVSRLRVNGQDGVDSSTLSINGSMSSFMAADKPIRKLDRPSSFLQRPLRIDTGSLNEQSFAKSPINNASLKKTSSCPNSLNFHGSLQSLFKLNDLRKPSANLKTDGSILKERTIIIPSSGGDKTLVKGSNLLNKITGPTEPEKWDKLQAGKTKQEDIIPFIDGAENNAHSGLHDSPNACPPSLLQNSSSPLKLSNRPEFTIGHEVKTKSVNSCEPPKGTAPKGNRGKCEQWLIKSTTGKMPTIPSLSPLLPKR